jgi:ribonuclease HI
MMLKNDQNEWVEDEEQLQGMVNSFYKNLFACNDNNIQWQQTRYSYPIINELEYNLLRENITKDEVKHALFAMAPWKAPGPDGFPAGFYQNGWSKVENSLCDFAKSVWRNPVDVATVNFIDICLIPKIDRPEFVSQFRPISLCNVSYKIITKIMVNRLKKIIPQVVSPFQTGFVPGRNITENIVIAQEMLHSMMKMRSRVGFFVIKVDLSKAYDRLNWDFIKKVLTEVNLPNEMINVIMSCITSVQSNVLWNGSRSEFFTPHCGVRQGDPMSPYLFVLCMDKLTHLIAEAVENGKWKPMRAGRSGPSISHLMFADDLLLFGQAVDENMTAVVEVLNKFCLMSGQQVNFDKSSIFFSRNVPTVRRVSLTAQSGLKETQSLGNYLGVPALGRAPRVQDFQYLVEKVKNRLAGWKAKQLSLAGRITLAKSVIQAIPTYPMMSMSIPKSCLQEIEKAQRAFIWGDTEDKRKAHVISWNTLTQPKDCGGLGLRNLQSMSEACLMKMGWSLMTGEHNMWGQVLRGKYGREGWRQGNITVKPSDSSLWKALARSWPKLELQCCWSVGNGSKVSFWDDKWIDENTRISDLDHPVPEEARGWRVKDVALPTGEWNFDLLQQVVPSSIVQKLHAIVPPHASHEADKQFWPGTATGIFTVSSAYYMLTKETLNDVNKRWKGIWKIESIERIRVFVWLLVHDRLLTKARLARWQLGNSFCHSCTQFEETTIHVMRDCPIAVNVWRHLLPAQDRGNFFTVGYHDWIQLNLSNKFGKNSENNWTAIWATACFLLWQWRNKSMHDEEFVSPEWPWQVIIDYVSMYKFSMRAEERIDQRQVQQWVNISWLPPPNGWLALNTDGAMKASERKAGCGGVLRSDTGVWIEGFSKALGDTTAYMAELWGIYEGLCLARRREVTKLEIRTDSQVIAHSLQNQTDGSVMGSVLIRKIRDLLNGPWEVKIIHIYREANRCADMLANMGSEGTSGIEFFVNPPVRVRQIVRDDVRGVAVPRLISL